MMKSKRGFDYRHIIAITLTVFVILISVFCFTSSYPRLGKSFFDLHDSLKYYVSDIAGLEPELPTVTEIDSKYFDLEFDFLPATWEEFKVKMSSFGDMFFNLNTFVYYLMDISLIAYWLSIALSIILPLILLLYILFTMYFSKVNNDYNEDSVALKQWRKIYMTVCFPVKVWCIQFIQFMKNNSRYLKLWLFFAALSFNLIAVCVSFFAYYFYFTVSFDFIYLYRQVYKLFIDFTVLSKLPIWCWIIIAFIIVCVVRRRIGYNRLEHNEMKNRGFLSEKLPSVFMFTATMGAGKTKTLTDALLSIEVMFRDKAFELMLELDTMFPNFPWINLELELQQRIATHEIYNLVTCEAFIERRRAYFEMALRDKRYKNALKYYSRHFKLNSRENWLFDYDFNHYGLTFDDGLKVENIWSVLKDYSKLYFIYNIQSSLIVANYSVRSDNVFTTLGNFPQWNTDFFKRDPKMEKAYSNHSHILDFDCFRLCRSLIENNKYRYAFEFGIFGVTEGGKERGNMLENQEKRKKDDETNQKNDGFDLQLKMSRHPAVIRNFAFFRIGLDEQRAMSLGANVRELAVISNIEGTDEVKLLMPCFALGEILYRVVYGSFIKLYSQYRYNRGDNTLLMSALKCFSSKVSAHYKRIYNTFGCYVETVSVYKGSNENEIEQHKYYIQPKKIYSNRFATDAFSDYYKERSKRSDYGIDDMPVYKTGKANFDELLSQNSYFINDISRFQFEGSTCRESQTGAKAGSPAPSETASQEIKNI